MNRDRKSRSNPAALQPLEPDPFAVYSIEATARIVGTSRHTILVYCRHGLVSPAGDPEKHGFYFDATAIRLLRQIEFLRAECEINITGIKRIVGLANEVRRLRAELRFLRE